MCHDHWPGVMWMILAILTIPGWRLWPSISTTQVARRCATKNLDNSFFYIFVNFQVGQLPLQAGDDAGAIQWMPLDAKVVVVTQMKFNFRDVPNFQLLSFNFPGDPVRQPQRFCWEGRWKVRSPLVNAGSICWCEQFRLHEYDKLEINIIEKLGAHWWCRLGL